MDSDTGKVALAQELVKFGSTKSTLDENDDLVEFEVVQQLIELTILLAFTELDVVLLKTVKGKLGLVIDVNLQRVLHKLLADLASVLRKCGTEHHNLLLSGSGTENLLHVATHVCHLLVYSYVADSCKPTNLVKHLVTLIQNELLDVAKSELLVADEGIHSTGRADDDVREGVLVSEQLDVFGNGCSSVKD